MRDRNHLLALASAAALALTLNHNVHAVEAEAAAPEATPTATDAATPADVSATAIEVAPAPPPPAEATLAAVPEAPSAPAAPTGTTVTAPMEAATAPTPAEVAQQRAEQHRADAMEQRGLRYEELRQRAAQAGVELPETPPWERIEPPEMPSLPTPPTAMPGKGMMSTEERAAHIEKMRNMTPEERMAEREARWAEMRERAAKRGIDLPETPPWKAAMERRKAMQEKWDAYRKTVEEMTDEQREAARAMFGRQAPTGGPASFGRPPFPGVSPQGAAPAGFGPPAMPAGNYGPCGRMPCQAYPRRNMGPQMGPRPPMMYPQRAPSGNQGSYRQ